MFWSVRVRHFEHVYYKSPMNCGPSPSTTPCPKARTRSQGTCPGSQAIYPIRNSGYCLSRRIPNIRNPLVSHEVKVFGLGYDEGMLEIISFVVHSFTCSTNSHKICTYVLGHLLLKEQLLPLGRMSMFQLQLARILQR